MKVHSKIFNKQDGTGTLTHTVHSLECHQLPSSTITTNQPSSPPISTCNIPTASSAGEKIAEILETPHLNTTPATVSLKVTTLAPILTLACPPVAEH
ncbi:hypothetical protein OROMI_006839 [Orobanche minor]